MLSEGAEQATEQSCRKAAKRKPQSSEKKLYSLYELSIANG